jgi:hypothetical protein
MDLGCLGRGLIGISDIRLPMDQTALLPDFMPAADASPQHRIRISDGSFIAGSFKPHHAENSVVVGQKPGFVREHRARLRRDIHTDWSKMTSPNVGKPDLSQSATASELGLRQRICPQVKTAGVSMEAGGASHRLFFPTAPQRPDLSAFGARSSLLMRQFTPSTVFTQALTPSTEAQSER